MYNELGIMTIKNRIIQRKLIFLHKLLNKHPDSLARKTLMEQIGMPGQTWYNNIIEELESLEIEMGIEEIEEMSKYKWKSRVKKRTWKKEQLEYYEWAEKSKKCNLMQRDKIEMKKYIKEFKYETAKIIMEVRLGMVDVKSNYRNKHEDSLCRECGREEETVEHFIQCQTKHSQKHKMKNFHEFWSLHNMENLKNIANHTLNILTNNPHFVYKK